MKICEILDVPNTAAGVSSNPCEDYERTYGMYVINDTQLEIKLCVFHAKCSFADELPEPYIADTGVFVGGVDLAPGENCYADPCGAGGSTYAPIAGNWGGCSARLLHRRSGQEKTLNFSNIGGGGKPGIYYPEMGWRIFYKSSFTDTGEKVKTVHIAPISVTKMIHE